MSQEANESTSLMNSDLSYQSTVNTAVVGGDTAEEKNEKDKNTTDNPHPYEMLMSAVTIAGRIIIIVLLSYFLSILLLIIKSSNFSNIPRTVPDPALRVSQDPYRCWQVQHEEICNFPPYSADCIWVPATGRCISWHGLNYRCNATRQFHFCSDYCGGNGGCRHGGFKGGYAMCEYTCSDCVGGCCEKGQCVLGSNPPPS